MTSSMFIAESKHRIKIFIMSLKHRVDAKPKLKRYILWLFKPFPKLKYKFKSIQPASKLSYLTMRRIDTPEQLPYRARQIYHELKKAVENQERGG